MTNLSDEVKEEFSRLLDERDERYRQDIEGMKQEIEELKNEIESSKDAVEALGFSGSIGAVQEQRNLQQSKGKSREEETKVQGVEIPLLPHDIFSYLAFVKICSKAMLITLIVIFVQLTSIIVLMVDIISHGKNSNWIDVPAGGMYVAL
jgi:hypothetical protein